MKYRKPLSGTYSFNGRKTRLLILLTAFLILQFAICISNYSIAATADLVPGRIIVKFKSTRALRSLSAPGQAAVQSLSTETSRLLGEAGMGSSRYLMPHIAGVQRSGDLAAQSLTERFPVRARRASAGATMPDMRNWVLIDVDKTTDIEALCEQLMQQGDVEYAEPDRIARPYYVPDDPYLATSGSWGQSFRDLWGIYALNATDAWDLTSLYYNNVVVAVLDTGVDYNHPDIIQNMWINTDEVSGDSVDNDGNGYTDDYYGYDFADGNGDPMAGITVDSEHGTHVAGTIGARGNNNLLVTGVCPTVQIMALKVFPDDYDRANFSDITSAVDYAVANGADVINLSLGGNASNSGLDAAIAVAAASGLAIIAAAGNDAADMDSSGIWSPVESDGSADNVVGVSAVSTSLGFSNDYSNYGSAVDIAGPGGNTDADILSLASSRTTAGSALQLSSGQLERKRGTSMACPHVAGTAALMLQVNPTMSYSAIQQRLYASASDLGTTGKDVYFGYGLVNALMAVAMSDPVAPTLSEYVLPLQAQSNEPFAVTISVSDNFDYGVFESLLPSVNVIYQYVVDNVTATGDWGTADIVETSSGNFYGVVPTPDLTISNIWYYIIAEDFNPSNDVTTPSNAPTNYFDLLLSDVGGPSINFDLATGEHLSLLSTQSIYIRDNVQTVTSSIRLGITDPNGSTTTFDTNSSLVAFDDSHFSFGWASSNYYAQSGEYYINVYAEDISANVNSLAISVNMTTLSERHSDFKILGPTGSGSPVLTYPNPFNPATQRTTFAYQLTQAAVVKIHIYSLSRREVWSASASQALGYHNEITWDGSTSAGVALPNGVYPFTITATSTTSGEVARERGKIVLLR